MNKSAWSTNKIKPKKNKPRRPPKPVVVPGVTPVPRIKKVTPKPRIKK